MRKILGERRRQFEAEYKQPALDLARRFVDEIGDGLEARDAAEALERYVNQLEEAFARIAARRSRLFWLHLARRVPAVPLESSTAWTTRLYRTILQLGLLKHGTETPEEDDFEIQQETGTLVPTKLEYQDCCDVYQLEYLAFELHKAATAYLRVGKGAVLRGHLNHFDTPAADDVENLMQLKDRRTAHNESMFDDYGSIADASTARQGDAAGGRSVWYAALNVEQQHLSKEVTQEFGFVMESIPSYLPGFLGIDAILNLLNVYKDQITALLVAPYKLLAFLTAVGIREQCDVRASEFFQRGYRVIRGQRPLADALGELACCYQVIVREQGAPEISDATARAEVGAIFEALTYSADELRQISLWDRQPYKVIVRQGEYCFWDHSNIPYFLKGLLSEVAFKDGEVGNLKSVNFENEVVALIQGTPGIASWEARKILKAADGTQRELDASFTKDDTLYVIECKAFSAHPRIDRGDWGALQTRWKQLTQYLTQARSLRAFLEANRHGRNYQVPDHVTAFEHCLCTPLTEYIPEVGSEYWLKSDTPRILVPAELITYVSNGPPHGPQNARSDTA